MNSTGLLSVALVVALSIACNGTRDEGQADAVGTSGEHSVSAAATDWSGTVAVGSMAEIELGQMAQRLGASAEVKNFGAMMVRDHTMAATEFKQVAASHQIALPSQLDEQHRELRDRLSKLNGADFDREYMNAMVQGHQDMLDTMQARIDDRPRDNDADVALNHFAATTLPTVQHHLDEAKRVRDARSQPGQ